MLNDTVLMGHLPQSQTQILSDHYVKTTQTIVKMPHRYMENEFLIIQDNTLFDSIVISYHSCVYQTQLLNDIETPSHWRYCMKSSCEHHGNPPI